jgi:dienelactone hydrolase
VRLTIAATLLALVLGLPANALATSAGQPFPSNRYTVTDHSQVTGLRVNLPQPNCGTNPSDCDDVAVLNTLDGFNIQPRISIPFSGPIDVSTVSSSTVFLLGGPGDHRVGINQIVWEPATKTLHVESDEQLAQDTTYLLVVTRGVRDAGGRPLDSMRLHDDDFRGEILDKLGPAGIAAASVFTTQSIDAVSKKIRQQLRGGEATFTAFPLSDVTGITLSRQSGTSTFDTFPLYLPLLASVGTIAFGSYASPDYETADAVIPPVGTRTGKPVVQSTNRIGFTLFLPRGPRPAGGWPVTIFGHGFGDSKDGAPWAVASTLANAGIATIAINVVGHGGGTLGTYTVSRSSGPPVVLPSGGRGVDLDHNGTIDSTEGASAIGAQSLVGTRDGLRQTVVDLMQLVKVLRGGVADLSRTRIYYSGQSFGGIYGVQLLGLEPDIRAGVPNVPGGSVIEVARLGFFRFVVGFALLTRTPSLYNAIPDAALGSFNENMPLRNQPPVIDTVPGASAIQLVVDNTEWANQSGNPAAYAPFITRPVIIQFARGDETVPNPTTSAIIRAGHLQSRTTLFRNDLTHAAFGTDSDPHTFLTNVFGPGAPFALQAQNQIATFFASDGATTIDPDGAAPYFETPTSMVPEDLAFLP